MVKDYFVNPDENRLRAGWRIFLFLVAAFLIATIVNGIVKVVFGGPPSDKTVSIVVRGVIVIVNATLMVGLMRRYIDKKPFVSLGLRFDGSGMLDLLNSSSSPKSLVRILSTDWSSSDLKDSTLS